MDRELSTSDKRHLGGYDGDIVQNQSLLGIGVGRPGASAKPAYIDTLYVGADGRRRRATVDSLLSGPLGQATRANLRGNRNTLIAGPYGRVTRATIPGTTPVQIGSVVRAKGKDGKVRTYKVVKKSATQMGSPLGQATRANLRGNRNTLIAGPYGRVTRATIPGTTPVQIGNASVDTSRAIVRNLKAKIREILAGKAFDSDNGVKLPAKTVSADTITALLTAKKNAFKAKHGVYPSQDRLTACKLRIQNEIAKHGGSVKGTVITVGMGAWYDSIGKITGGIVGKVVQFGTNVAVGAGKSMYGIGKAATWDLAKNLVYNPVKKTFFAGSGAKAQPVNVIPPGYYDDSSIVRQNLIPGAMTLSISPQTRALALQMARQRQLNATQIQTLQARIEAAKGQAQLRQMADAEEQQIAALAAQAAEAEAEAQAMQESSSGMLGWDEQAKIMSLMGNSIFGRISSAVLGTAGSFAKLLTIDNPLQGAVKAMLNIYKGAKSDPKGAERVAVLKAAAAAGDPEAEKAMDVLKIGKATDEQLKAAKVVETTLAKAAVAETAKAEASSSGMGAEIIASSIGMLPSNERVISVVPGAVLVYQLARKGNKQMLDAVAYAADLLRKSKANDPVASNIIAEYGKKAKDGDKAAQMFMAASAVAAAGLREEAQLAATKAVPEVAAEAAAQSRRLSGSEIMKKKIDAAVAKYVAPIAPQVERSVRKLTGAADYEQGLAIKLGHGAARKRS